MVLAGGFGLLLLVVLLAADWYQFTSLNEAACRYGCPLARRGDQFVPTDRREVSKRFTKQGLLELPHGLARFVKPYKVIVIRPHYHLFSLRFRTAWPLKGTIDLSRQADELSLVLVKRTPWSSAVITMLWLGLVVIGTLAFVVMYAADGGFSTGSGFLLALGIVALGILVLVFGLILLSLAYRLEDQRLTQVYDELLGALGKPPEEPSAS